MYSEFQEDLKLLELGENCSASKVKSNYRLLAKVLHPDNFKNDEKLRRKAADKLGQINNAYQRLKRHIESGNSFTSEVQEILEAEKIRQEVIEYHRPYSTYFWRVLALALIVSVSLFAINSSFRGKESSIVDTADTTNIDSNSEKIIESIKDQVAAEVSPPKNKKVISESLVDSNPEKTKESIKDQTTVEVNPPNITNVVSESLVDSNPEKTKESIKDQTTVEVNPPNITNVVSESLVDPNPEKTEESIKDQTTAEVNPDLNKIFKPTEVDVLPEHIKQILPKYPARLRLRGITGEVKLKIIVDKGGKVSNYIVVHSTNSELRLAVKRVIKKWTFKPATKNGVPVACEITIPFLFAEKGDKTL